MATGFFESLTHTSGSIPEIAWGLYSDLDATQWVTRPDVEKHQLTLVSRLLQHAGAAIPYYRELLSKANINPESIDSWDSFRRLPVITRQTYQEHFRSFLATQLPAGRALVAKPTVDGPTALPIVSPHTNITQMMSLALLLREMEWAGMDPRSTLAVLRTPVPGDAPMKNEHWAGTISETIQSGPLYHLNINATTEDHLRWLQEIQPAVFISDANHLSRIAALALEKDVQFPNLKLVHSLGAPVPPEVESRIARGFRVPVLNSYVSPEAGLIASPVPVGGLLHVHAESVIVEVLSKTNRPCGPGKRGRVVLTTLRNEFAPLIRFETGDEAIVGPGESPVGRGLPTLAEVFPRKAPVKKNAKSPAPKSRKGASKRRARS